MPEPRDADPVATWVRRLNALGRKLDEEAAALHPSAWPDALGPDIERWKRLAAGGPGGEVTGNAAGASADLGSGPQHPGD